MDARLRLLPASAAELIALYAGIRVRDFAAAWQWYERLLGDSSFLAHATEAVWTLADEPIPASALQSADGRAIRR